MARHDVFESADGLHALRRASGIRWIIVLCLCLGATAGCTDTRDGAATGRAHRGSDGSLFVVRADEVKVRGLAGGAIEAELDAGSEVVWFSDRPIRKAGTMTLERLAAGWDGFGFKGDPPNGAIEVDSGSAAGVVAVKISAPRFTSHQRLRFQLGRLKGAEGFADLRGSLPKSGWDRLGSASLFIDPSDINGSFSYPSDRRYTSDGVWAQVADGVATIGVSDAYLDTAGSVLVVSPGADEGSSVDRDDPLAEIETVNQVEDVNSPVTGTVAEVNASIESDPDTGSNPLNTDPYGSGWIARIKLDDPTQVDKMLSPADYVASLPDSQKPSSNESPLRSPTPAMTVPPVDQGKYIVAFSIVSGTKAYSACPSGMTKNPQDLNEGSGGNYVNLCTRRGPSRDLQPLIIGGSAEPVSRDGIELFGYAPGKPPKECDPTNLNDGAGGSFIYLCEAQTMSGYTAWSTAAILDLRLTSTTTGAYQCPDGWEVVQMGDDIHRRITYDSDSTDDAGVLRNSYVVNGDLNQKARGRFIHLCQDVDYR